MRWTWPHKIILCTFSLNSPLFLHEHIKTFLFLSALHTHTALIKLQSLVNPPMHKTIQFTFRKSDKFQFRETLKDIRTRGIYSMIIDTRPENLPHLLTAVSFWVLIFFAYSICPPAFLDLIFLSIVALSIARMAACQLACQFASSVQLNLRFSFLQCTYCENIFIEIHHELMVFRFPCFCLKISLKVV